MIDEQDAVHKLVNENRLLLAVMVVVILIDWKIDTTTNTLAHLC